ncbi:hypothetical protein [Paraburkholderia atlantica]|uniref:hypothetical protein n=1 Tax=Paraburkholderia atlantica TaxID=2654982 RepID=UPI0002FC5E71|nr:hypothetical protein [Paraburkholderia atlantica]
MENKNESTPQQSSDAPRKTPICLATPSLIPVGFIVAAVAPLVAGIVRGWSGGFAAAWLMLASCIAAMMAVTLLFSPRSYSRWL